ncbi:MAG: hydantoinase/carbamoylase family amidase [Pseudorhodoplanes sp.]|nr:N-carbamoyl-L-amino-acid hydrolase [Pseudorhodoplanes sp.]MBW7948481.1 hydantoinase/carbamoylase family amidase [Pseudorhodoplanes sp.]MCL4711140.1 hydantoinase/carbamoylase family amidase [Pseudorhodoplanes sp.]GIK80300.1 MAG: Zn-dependent hydrolase [Alphaproteobacteria bacterium]
MKKKLFDAIDSLAPSLADLFKTIAQRTSDGVGISRDAYGEVETAAGDILIRFAHDVGLDAGYDRVGNVNVAAKGRLAEPATILIGSHIDSVPRGGNYDGLAGVVAGIGALAALQKCGDGAAHGVHTLGFRGEESPWFGTAYLGSKLLTGQMSRAEAENLRRFDTKKTLAEHLRQLGVNLDDLGRPAIPLDKVRAYFELHIEQAPLLEDLGKPIGIATAVRGNIRYPFAKCFGRYAHSGAVPRHLRADALMATAKLIAYCDEIWHREIKAGHDDLVFTCGVFQTNSTEHSMTKVPGEISFTFNVGGINDEVMERFHREAMAKADALAKEHHVRFEFGTRVGTGAVGLDPGIAAALDGTAREAGIEAHRMPTVGHDAAMFVKRGTPAGIVLIRNANGSHNPAEHMEMDDFTVGLKVLTATVSDMTASRR